VLCGQDGVAGWVASIVVDLNGYAAQVLCDGFRGRHKAQQQFHYFL